MTLPNLRWPLAMPLTVRRTPWSRTARTVSLQWYRRFGDRRILHGTAHDVLMATPGLGEYFRAGGTIPPTKKAMATALKAGHDVILWPGGEQDSMRNWRKRDKAVLAGRKGFVRFAIQQQVPIVPVATVGGHDTVFVLSEGRFLARWSGLGKRMRGSTMPIISGFLFPLAIEILPMHLPLPAKIRTELLDPIELDTDPTRSEDDEYVSSIYARSKPQFRPAWTGWRSGEASRSSAEGGARWRMYSYA